ncbi:hypothetical protein COU95_00750 [Candidatus Shapirobacteria bacterium CG10_big_fil_rev_8_21_14_0_10_40_9]|uniref:Uncharacterized protein n=1 Tax=Candidatus Shapirobacteria bacterium CG10_big_fil_rev_8_21_14_0_10_40_9 TaxID=1974888 RepID=A0A2M8L475_9BACT|nr:MAG: hypothetical protein COU95_00750 [Candidatus Shapirobacteria bacterium CG10_big_fil_rev_8_21_14_0_10_40_9]
MPRFSLPKIPRFSPIFFLLIFVLLILAVEAGYYYFRVKRRPAPQPVFISEEAKKEAEELKTIVKSREERSGTTLEAIKQALEEQKEEIEAEKRLMVSEACRWVPKTDPTIGIYKLDRPLTGIVEYFYEARIEKVEEAKVGDCVFDNLILTHRQEFTVAIPRGLLASGALGEVPVSFLAQFKGNFLNFRVRYQEEQKTGKLKIIEWEIIYFITD